MRVLLVHNRYRHAGGEERAVAEIAALLERHGHTAAVLERSSTGAGRARSARGLLAGGIDPEEVGRAVRRMRADVVHAHNLQPLLGWRALAAARAEGARTVLHLHNLRLFCAIAVAYRDGAPCYRCHDGWTAPGVALRCRGSLAESAVYAAGLARGWKRMLEHADRVLSVSRSTAARLRGLGVHRPVGVLANFAPAPRERSLAPEGRYALAAGRLVEEKGFDTAIAAARAAGVPLVIAGAGPDEARLRGLAGDGEVTFAGQVSEVRLGELREGAGVLLAPSRWEEPCPYVVLDALAAGVPVLGSDRGGLPELLEGQVVLPAGETRAWETALAELWRDPARRAVLGERGLSAARESFGEMRYLERLLEAYG